MQSTNPSQSNFNRPDGPLRHAQSVFKVLNAGIQLAQPTGQNAAGIYNKFEPDNGNGVMIRIGAIGGAETYNWTGNNVGLAINHGLHKQPIGFIVCDIDAAANVYRTVTPTADTITLAITNDLANVTVYIF